MCVCVCVCVCVFVCVCLCVCVCVTYLPLYNPQKCIYRKIINKSLCNNDTGKGKLSFFENQLLMCLFTLSKSRSIETHRID